MPLITKATFVRSDKIIIITGRYNEKANLLVYWGLKYQPLLKKAKNPSFKALSETLNET